MTGTRDASSGATAATPDRLDAIARKYRALVALRARRDGGGAPATRDELRALATEFPGCLRELDTLGPGELGRRAAAAAAAAVGGAREPWMDWIVGYHALMSEALAVRAQGATGGAADGDALAAAALAPPEGRLNIMVLRELGARFGVAAATIAETLFPLRRPSPYQL
jgi:hypothetical protein